MNKPSLSAIAKGVRTAMKKHSPEILTGIGIAGMITTTIMAVRATPKALRLMDEEIKIRLHNNTQDEQENVEGLIKVPDDKHGEYGHYRLPATTTIKTVWKPYLPAAITATASIACLIGASSVNLKRNAALATAYSLSETALREYKSKVIETIGEKKEKSIRDAVSKDKMDKTPIKNNEVIITGSGDTLCFDVHTGRYFNSDINMIKKAVNELNHRMLTDINGFISLNEFYYEIGLQTVERGDDLGWHVEKGLIDLSFSSQLAPDGKPCLVIDYGVAPQYDYRK